MRGPVHPCRHKMRLWDWLSVALIGSAVGFLAVPAVLPEILRAVQAVPAVLPECPAWQDRPGQVKVFEL